MTGNWPTMLKYDGNWLTMLTQQYVHATSRACSLIKLYISITSHGPVKLNKQTSL
jgi:hypothetical protein